MTETPSSPRHYWETIAGGGTWASYYDHAPDAKTYNFFTRRDTVLRMLAGEGRRRRILDVGCGTADYAVLSGRHGADYVGVDFSLSMIDQARDRVSGEAGRHLFAVGAGDELAFKDDSFDLVVAVGYIEYFEDPAQTLEELRRVMTPGGVLLMQSFKHDLLGRVRGWLAAPLRKRRGRDARLPEGWVDRKYSGRELDALLADHGFVRTDRTFNNFYLLPELVRRKLPRLYMTLSEAAGRVAPNLLGFAAVNYIGRYELRDSAR